MTGQRDVHLPSSSAGPVRHRESGVWLVRFTERLYVVCPGCGGRAVVVPRPGLPVLKYSTELLFRPRRLACAGCGAVAEWEAATEGRALRGADAGGTEDPFFRRPLWLQTRCAGQVLWAYNEEHVAELTAYVGAQLRERGGFGGSKNAMIPRLAAWLKRAENRAEVLAGLDRLRGLAERSAPADRSDAAYEQGERPQPQRNLYFRGGAY
ncbi:hypothetical protein [Streptomyces sp. NPDC048442]|uniref:hypothetical protein n=1 Tax=Streptomyces sp. NPDC048442 TaxID=3154823 RepID=UPI003418F161